MIQSASADDLRGARILKSRENALQDFFFRAYELGGVSVEVTADDARLLDEIESTIPAQTQGGGPACRVLRARFSTSGDQGLLSLDCDDPGALGADDLLLGLQSEGFPFRSAGTDGEGWLSFAFLDDQQPLFSFRGQECMVRKRERWRSAVAFLLIHRIYRLRRDAIFFHAATVDVSGRGVMIIGPKGAGKSTTALALAARGMKILGDETACYVPATGMLEPFLRPVGIKPGVRAGAIEAAMRRIGVSADDDVLRIDVRRLIDAPAAAPLPLKSILFLGPFRSEPALERQTAGRSELAALQPVVSSLVSASHTRRVFEMARMLESSSLYRLYPGDPDATAELIATRFSEEEP